MDFLALFTRLPTRASTGRMRVWRALKILGCATLRDGVYLLPDAPEHVAALNELADEVQASKGSAEVYRLSGRDDAQDTELRALFDRGEDYAVLTQEAAALQQDLAHLDGVAASRRQQALMRRFEQLLRVDFFPGEAQRQVLAAMDRLREAVSRHLAPDEPSPCQVVIPRLDHTDYQGRTWATRARPWVDRLASAWLIKRYIDPQADFVWLDAPADCRADWLGFDFDGATFSHAGARVTFETLATSFGLEKDPALSRLGELVHYLDVGGLPVADAAGIESLLGGLRASEPDDDVLLDRAIRIFDWLLQNYKGNTT